MVAHEPFRSAHGCCAYHVLMRIPGRSLSGAAFRFVVFAFTFTIAWMLLVQVPATEAHQSSLSWASCGGGFQCATLAVPLDYANPDARNIELALVRQPARDPVRRIGALLLNPGGPAGSGIEITRAFAPWLGTEI